MVGEDEQFLPFLDRELKSFIKDERSGNKDEYSETRGEHGLPDSLVPLFRALCAGVLYLHVVPIFLSRNMRLFHIPDHWEILGARCYSVSRLVRQQRAFPLCDECFGL